MVVVVVVVVVVVIVVVVETGFLCVALAVLKLILQTMLTLNSQRSPCLCLPSVGIEVIHTHAQHICLFVCLFVCLGRESVC